MIGIESLIDCLHTSFRRIRSRRSSRVRPIHKVIQMINTESLLDCLRTSFGRIKSRRSSKVRPIHKVIQMIKTESLLDCLRTSFGRIRSRRSSSDLTYSMVVQMSGTESLIDCLRTSFGRIRSRRSSKVVGRHLVNHVDDKDLWSSLPGDFKMSLFKRKFENDLNFSFKTLWCRNLSLQCGVLINFEKNHFFLFQMSKR